MIDVKGISAELAVGLVLGIGLLAVVAAVASDDSPSDNVTAVSGSESSEPSGAPGITSGSSASAVSTEASETSASAAVTADAEPPDTTRAAGRTSPTVEPAAESVPTSTATTTTAAAATTTTAAATTTTLAATTSTMAPAAATYDTLPDGSPTPVVAIFDISTITLTGAVPDQAAVDRLGALALANSKFPATLNNQLTINPAVPRNVGARIVELTSTRFPESSFEILPPHAAELDRVANVMNALPNTTVLVIGHADQRGDEVTNFRLSEERARAVVNYLTMKGIAPARLSSRAVGEADMLTLNDDAAALALNRRTEFIFYGLINA